MRDPLLPTVATGPSFATGEIKAIARSGAGHVEEPTFLVALEILQPVPFRTRAVLRHGEDDGPFQPLGSVDGIHSHPGSPGWQNRRQAIDLAVGAAQDADVAALA